MRRLLTHSAVTLLLSGIGLTALVYAGPSRVSRAAGSSEPLRVRIISVERDRSAKLATPRGTFAAYRIKVSVENVSGRTVRGYSLRAGVGALGGSTLPDPERQTLRPGETREEVILRPLPHDCPTSGFRVDVDFVNFSDGTTWGANQTYARDFIRG